MPDGFNLISFYRKFPDEQSCRDFIQNARWGSVTTCPKCGVADTKIYKLKDSRLLKCATCRSPFSVRVGAVFEDSAIPLQSWFLAIYLCTSLKKGISSVQLAKYLGITQKSAWHMLHRIRHNVTDNTLSLEGVVEVDETYWGGKTGRRDMFKNKVAVIGAVEKKKDTGRIKTTVTRTADATVALPFMRSAIKQGSTVQTDESKIYHRVKREYAHQSVNHSEKEYVREAVSTNTIEGAWDHLKLGLRAIYMGRVTAKHLASYCDEFSFRYNFRDMSDGERFATWFKFSNGKRLTWQELTAK
ncbi:MAG TPA: IS1595 family transposase [Candidatus Saccharimonadales bacterium]|nr:IS1595 family transposase [Candidatus Saccharimonadales bacterium]